MKGAPDARAGEAGGPSVSAAAVPAVPATLVWSWAIGLAIVAGVIGGEKLLNRFLPAPDWVPFAVAGRRGPAGGRRVVALFSGPSRLDAAVAIDRVFHLNERLSSALTLPEDLRETPAGQALIADAIRKVTDLDVAAEFGLRMPRRAWVVLIPAAASVLLLFAPAWFRGRPGQDDRPQVDTKAIAKQTQVAHQEDRQPAPGDRQGEVPRGRQAPGPDPEEVRRAGQGPARRPRTS